MLNAYEAAGSVAEELSLQQIDAKAQLSAGGLWTIPTTNTIGWICTLSWECTSPHKNCGN